MQEWIVALIVTGAALYALRQLWPASLGRRAPVSAARTRQPYAGCHGCPASADCGKRR